MDRHMLESPTPARTAARARPDRGSVTLAAVAAFACVVVSRALQDRSSHSSDLLAVAVAVLACVPIAFWRASPVVMAALVMAIAVTGTVSGLAVSGAMLLALALVGQAASGAEGRMTTTLGLLSGAGVAVAAVATADSKPVLAAFGGFAVGLLPAIFGERLRVERARAAAATELATRVEELRDGDVQRAVVEERLRIARDVHDITGHHLSAISLQSAGAARTTTDPATRVVLERIHRLTSEALGQTRGVLGVLRDHDAAPALAPPPRLAHVAQLLEPARAAGIDADLTVRGDVRDLPGTVEMSAYRVVQESVTNVLRHSGARLVRVVVDYGPTALEIAIDDDGTGPPDDARRAGSGVEGMRERVALVGGELSAGEGRCGGWSVRAVLPLEVGR
jgi:signal transduction histidine kinase